MEEIPFLPKTLLLARWTQGGASCEELRRWGRSYPGKLPRFQTCLR